MKEITTTIINGVVVNTTKVTTSHVLAGKGFVTLKGKGGLSAGNPLKMNVTVYLNRTAWGGKKPSSVMFKPLGARPYPPITDQLGFPLYLSLQLAEQSGDKWLGNARIVYNQGGTMAIDFTIDNVEYTSPDTIQIGPESITVAARTNSVVISLTWAVLAFAVLGIRVNIERYEPK